MRRIGAGAVPNDAVERSEGSTARFPRRLAQARAVEEEPDDAFATSAAGAGAPRTREALRNLGDAAEAEGDAMGAFARARAAFKLIGNDATNTPQGAAAAADVTRRLIAAYVRRADILKARRGAAAAATWIVFEGASRRHRFHDSRRRRGCHVDVCESAARRRRFYDSRRRGNCHVDGLRKRGAATRTFGPDRGARLRYAGLAVKLADDEDDARKVASREQLSFSGIWNLDPAERDRLEEDPYWVAANARNLGKIELEKYRGALEALETGAG